MYDKEINEVFEKLNIIEKLYDRIRIVDPVQKQVIDNYGREDIDRHLHCFGFWGGNKVCNNCVSMMAYSKNDSFVKLEYAKNELYMLIAVPVQLGDRRVVLELMKNLTHSIVLQGSEGEGRQTMDGMIDNINLIASKDPLTGVYNRKFIYEKLPAVLINAAISGHRIGMIMADIDHFKRVNDTFGHLAGDEVLKAFAKVLAGELKRETDWVARYGGEEFLICIPGASRDITFEAAERMRKVFENTEVKVKGSVIRSTASFGVFNIVPTTGVTIENLIEGADKNLYLAKNNGRNRVEG